LEPSDIFPVFLFSGDGRYPTLQIDFVIYSLLFFVLPFGILETGFRGNGLLSMGQYGSGILVVLIIKVVSDFSSSDFHFFLWALSIKLISAFSVKLLLFLIACHN
jgi:hypothetical protein